MLEKPTFRGAQGQLLKPIFCLRAQGTHIWIPEPQNQDLGHVLGEGPVPTAMRSPWDYAVMPSRESGARAWSVPAKTAL